MLSGLGTCETASGSWPGAYELTGAKPGKYLEMPRIQIDPPKSRNPSIWTATEGSAATNTTWFEMREDRVASGQDSRLEPTPRPCPQVVGTDSWSALTAGRHTKAYTVHDKMASQTMVPGLMNASPN